LAQSSQPLSLSPSLSHFLFFLRFFVVHLLLFINARFLLQKSGFTFINPPKKSVIWVPEKNERKVKLIFFSRTFIGREKTINIYLICFVRIYLVRSNKYFRIHGYRIGLESKVFSGNMKYVEQ
jgi:hypothetical protein